jgi:hypothetical protein
MAHEAMSGVEAVPWACQVIVVPLSVPLAVPTACSPPAQVALKEPAAAVADCWLGVHVKSVQLDADGMMFVDADFHVPTSASAVGAAALVGAMVLLSYP